MPLFMTQFSYTSEAWAAFVRSPEDRSVILRTELEKLGGQLLSFYYSLGEYDGLVIYEAPDETTAAAAVLTAIAPGHLKTTKTNVLLTVDNGIQAMSKARGLGYVVPNS